MSLSLPLFLRLCGTKSAAFSTLQCTGGPKHSKAAQWRETPPGLAGSSEFQGEQGPFAPEEVEGVGNCLSGSLLLAYSFFPNVCWRCSSWAAGDKFSAFTGALGWLFVTAQHCFLTVTFLLSLFTLRWGSMWPPAHCAGVKAFALLCH